MKLDKQSGTVINLEEAVSYTHSFQEQQPEATKSFYVGAEKIRSILQQEGCMGIRMYNGNVADANNEIKTNLVLVGVNEEGEDMTDGIILERLIRCPTICPKQSPLIKR